MVQFFIRVCILYFGLSTSQATSIFAYQDEELTTLWSSIANINQPNLTDYQQIEFYLNHGKRPYLDILERDAVQVHEDTRRRLTNIRNFKLLGPNQKMPITEIHHVNITEKTKDRCILLFSSFNGIYPDKAREVLEELKLCGYSGDILLQIGGFPNVHNGGLKICHIPYAFKVAFLLEARERGYKKVLWIDTCMHPLSDLEDIFSKVTEDGYYFTYVGNLTSNLSGHLLKAARSLNIGLQHYDGIMHIASGIFGLNMEDLKANQLLDEWFIETEKVYPSITWFPEELSLSVVVWRLGLKADSWIGMVLCLDNEVSWLPLLRPTIQFYCDNIR